MGRLKADKLHMQFAAGAAPDGPLTPRRYTLTHSDATGDLFLTIGADYDLRQLGGSQARFMRDEVLAEWRHEPEGPALHVDCHVSGGLVLGSAGWRDAIFRQELPLALEAMCYGDRRLLDSRPKLEHAPVWVHFHARQEKYDVIEHWGTVADYLPSQHQGVPS